MYDEIVDVAAYVRFVVIEPHEIDHYVWFGTRRRKLNYLETIHMAKVIRGLEAPKVIIDAPDTNIPMFTAELSAMLEQGDRDGELETEEGASAPRACPLILARHKADRDYTIVSAASIIAKVERDRAVENLRSYHGDFGSGYPSDPDTISFLRAWIKRTNSQPEFARKSWRTWDRIFTLDLVGDGAPGGPI